MVEHLLLNVDSVEVQHRDLMTVLIKKSLKREHRLALEHLLFPSPDCQQARKYTLKRLLSMPME
jgi:hypothetical protein